MNNNNKEELYYINILKFVHQKTLSEKCEDNL